MQLCTSSTWQRQGEMASSVIPHSLRTVWVLDVLLPYLRYFTSSLSARPRSREAWPGVSFGASSSSNLRWGKMFILYSLSLIPYSLILNLYYYGSIIIIIPRRGFFLFQTHALNNNNNNNATIPYSYQSNFLHPFKSIQWQTSFAPHPTTMSDKAAEG